MSPIVITRVAHAGAEDHRFFGHGALTELLGQETATGLLALAALGRRVTPEERELLDALAVSLTAADPRIWPLKAARLAASYGETLAGLAAGQLAMMGTNISPRIIGAAAEHLARLRAALGAEALDPAAAERVVLRHMSEGGRLAGYGIPMREQDERLQALRGYMDRTGRATRPHWRAQEALSTVMIRERRLAPNIGIGLAAALLDIGCRPDQAGALAVFLIQHDFAANAFEAAQQQSADVQRLPVECVAYVGRGPRRSPRAEAAGG